jgi:hypothetical protein
MTDIDLALNPKRDRRRQHVLGSHSQRLSFAPQYPGTQGK